MPRLEEFFPARRLGITLPAWLTDRIHRFYPRVHVGWSAVMQQWVLVMAGQNGTRELIRVLPRGERPNLRNTLHWLLQHDMRKLGSREEKDAILRRMDEHNESMREAVRKSVSERWAEGSRRIWREVKKPLVMTKPTG